MAALYHGLSVLIDGEEDGTWIGGSFSFSFPGRRWRARAGVADDPLAMGSPSTSARLVRWVPGAASERTA